MLFINNKQISDIPTFLKEIERISGKTVDIDALKTNASFTYNNIVTSYNLGKFRSQRIKTPNINRGSEVLSNFKFYSEKLEAQFEIRYASKLPHQDMTRGGAFVYTPRNLDIPSGEFGFLKKELDLALFLLIHPDCLESPFRGDRESYRYSHNNLKEASNKIGRKMSALQSALNHVDEIVDEELKLFAKGLGLAIMDHMDSEDIRNELKAYAVDNIAEYTKAKESHSITFLGLIQECLDQGWIKVSRVGDNTVYTYDHGIHKGNQIVVVPPEIQNTVEYLKSHIGNNMASHHHILVNMNRTAAAGMNMENYLSSQKNGIPENLITNENDYMKVSDIKVHKDAMEYLKMSHPEGNNTSQTKGAEFFKLVESGVITDDNVDEYIATYIGKVG